MEILLLCYMVWRETKLEALQTRTIFQILLSLWNNSLVVSALINVFLMVLETFIQESISWKVIFRLVVFGIPMI